MRDSDLDPTGGQILHPRTAPTQLQIRLLKLNRSPQSWLIVSLHKQAAPATRAAPSASTADFAPSNTRSAKWNRPS